VLKDPSNFLISNKIHYSTVLSLGKAHLYSNPRRMFRLLFVRAIVNASSQFSVLIHSLTFSYKLL
jgi:hypothetical protein